MARKKTGMSDSRLAEIFEYQKAKGKGTLGALGGAVGGRVLEKLDIRNLLFGGPGVTSRSLSQSIGKSIFGQGYRAAPSRRERFDEAIGRGLESPESTKVFSAAIEDSLNAIDSKMTILVKNSIAQNRMSRDINVIRQNVVMLTKKQVGTARTKADMYFMNAKQREKDYERQFAKEEERRKLSGETDEDKKDKKDKKEGSLASKLFKTALGIGGIYAVIKGIESIVSGFVSIKENIENFSKQIQEKIQQFREFDFGKWFESLSPEKISEYATTALNALKSGFESVKNAIMGAINKIDDATIGDFIVFIGNSFLDVMKFVFKTFMRGLETLSSDELMKLAAAGGLYALLFGGTGAKAAGGLMGRLLSGVFSGIAKSLPALLAVLMTPGGLIALGIAGLFAAMKLYFDGEVGGEAGAKRLRNQQKTIDAEKARTLSVEDWGKYVEGVAPEIRKDPETLERRKSLLSMRQIGESATKIKDPELGADLAAQINRQKFEGAMSPTAMERTRIEENRKRANSVAGGGGWRPPPRASTETTAAPQNTNTPEKLPSDSPVSYLAGSPVIPGQKLNEEQMNAVQIKMEMGNELEPEIKKAYELTKFGKSSDTTTATSTPPAPSTPEKVDQPTEKPSNVLRVQSTPSGLPSGFDYDTYTKRVGYMESGNDYGIVNTIGYAGRYQFGAQALETLGYMKIGSSKQGNKAMRDPSNWNNGLSLEKFLASPEIQDEAMAKYTAMNYKQLASKGIVNENTSSNELAGWLYVSHGVGVGGATEFAKGGDPAEGYGTKASQMFAKASGMSHPGDSATGFKMSPFSGGAASSPQLSGGGPSMFGGMFSAAGDKMQDLGDMIINVVNNSSPKAQEVMNEGMAALSSIDMNSIKDMMSPIIARTMLTQI